MIPDVVCPKCRWKGTLFVHPPKQSIGKPCKHVAHISHAEQRMCTLTRAELTKLLTAHSCVCEGHTHAHTEAP